LKWWPKSPELLHLKLEKRKNIEKIGKTNKNKREKKEKKIA
jgi:hypothetical protein